MLGNQASQKSSSSDSDIKYAGVKGRCYVGRIGSYRQQNGLKPDYQGCDGRTPNDKEDGNRDVRGARRNDKRQACREHTEGNDKGRRDVTRRILCRNRCSDNARGSEDKEEYDGVCGSKSPDGLQYRRNKAIDRVVTEHGNGRE